MNINTAGGKRQVCSLRKKERMKVKIKRDSDFYSHLINITNYCCEDMKDEFSGEYASQINFNGKGNPGIYFYNSDYETGEEPFYHLNYCPFCGKKIKIIET